MIHPQRDDNAHPSQDHVKPAGSFPRRGLIDGPGVDDKRSLLGTRDTWAPPLSAKVIIREPSTSAHREEQEKNKNAGAQQRLSETNFFSHLVEGWTVAGIRLQARGDQVLHSSNQAGHRAHTTSKSQPTKRGSIVV